MRFAAVVAVFVILLGLVGGTRSLLDPSRRADRNASHKAFSGEERESGIDIPRYRLRLTPTFDAERDPFALRSADDTPPVRLLVNAGGVDLHRRFEDWRRGEPVVLEEVELKGSHVDLFVMATPSESEIQRACGIRVEVFNHKEMLCDDRTLWTEAGTVLSQHSRFSLHPGDVTLLEAGHEPTGEEQNHE